LAQEKEIRLDVTPPVRGTSELRSPLDNSTVPRYYRDVIRSFRGRDTEALFRGDRVARFRQIESGAMRKLAILNQAGRLGDLQVPPGNRLEALKGRRVGQHSIRVNDQYRICFRWTEAGPEDVEIVDYH